MYGTYIGDVAGSSYEFGTKPAEGFSLLDGSRKNTYTDDTVLTAAVCAALMQTGEPVDPAELRWNVRVCLQRYAINFPFAGYGARFWSWVDNYEYSPYNSFGSGAASRIAPVAWVGKTAEEVMALSDICTKVTHDHPEGVKGARAVSLAIFLARQSSRSGSAEDRKRDLEKIRQSIQQRFYRLDLTMDEVRKSVVPKELRGSCQVVVPRALTAFLCADSFEGAVRNAVGIGDDADTTGAVAGAVAEAFWGVPPELKANAMALAKLDPRLTRVFDEFEERYQQA